MALRGRIIVPIGSLLVVLALAPAPATAGRCNRAGSDAAAVDAARDAIASACPCDAAASRRDHVHCASEVLAALVAAGDLKPSCRGPVRACAVRSTCGRPGAVACCRTSRSGTVRCRIERDASRCRAPRGGAACVSDSASCCDACDAGGCARVCGDGIVDPGEQCDGHPLCDPDCRLAYPVPTTACCDFGGICGTGPASISPSDCAAGGGTSFYLGAYCEPSGEPCPFPGIPCTPGVCAPEPLPALALCCAEPAPCRDETVTDMGAATAFLAACGLENARVGTCGSGGGCDAAP